MSAVRDLRLQLRRCAIEYATTYSRLADAIAADGNEELARLTRARARIVGDLDRDQHTALNAALGELGGTT